MIIELFELEGKVVKPTKHCYTIAWLKILMDKFPDESLKMYQYIYYMCAPGKTNPYSNLAIDIKEDAVLKDIEADFDTENPLLVEALTQTKRLMTTVTVRAHDGIKIMLDNIIDYMSTATVTSGRDGNINSLLKIAKDFDDIRKSYKGAAKDLEDELDDTRAKGGQSLAYDQM